MKKIILFAMAVCCMGQAMAQHVDPLLFDFEMQDLPHPQMDYTQTLDTGNYFFNDEDPASPYFEHAAKRFYGRKNSDNSFNGFTYSNIVDSVGIDSLERRAAFPGSGHNRSAQFAVAHGLTCNAWYAQEPLMKPTGEGESWHVLGFYVTNTTYNVLTMLNGDSTSKKFGGENGTDPDWFLLTIKGYEYGNLVDSTQFYLADFRSDTSAQDYIVKDWQWVDLSNWSDYYVDSFSFSLSSSDMDSNGLMRTPAWFCIDDIASPRPTGGGIHEICQNGLFKIYPNPVASGGQLFLENKKQQFSNNQYTVSLYNFSGAQVMERQAKLRKPLTLPQLPPGIYTILIHNKQQPVYSQKLLLQ